MLQRWHLTVLLSAASLLAWKAHPELEAARPTCPAVIHAAAVAPAAPAADDGPLAGLAEGHYRVRGVVLDTAGHPEPAVRVRACSTSTVTDGLGRFELDTDHPRCAFQAVRNDGLLTTESETSVVRASSDQLVEVELVLDERLRGGIGVTFESAPQGARVVRVLPGTPADDAGIQVGDIITEVNGVSTEWTSSDRFQTLATGVEGSSVFIEVSRDGETETHRLTRTFLPGYLKHR
jgi:membrane-associated protease RseP (regulator of RpoE activity)